MEIIIKNQPGLYEHSMNVCMFFLDLWYFLCREAWDADL